ncbi:UNVERIFIED_CONTAM: hypothetical protein C3P00_18585 [Clostridioides difficile]
MTARPKGRTHRWRAERKPQVRTSPLVWRKPRQLIRPSVSNRGAQNSRKQAKKKRKSRKAQGFPSHSGGCDTGGKMSHPHDWRDND